jgi:hypothetical protein
MEGIKLNEKEGMEYVVDLAKGVFPNIRVIGNEVFMKDQMLFSSTDNQSIQSFLFGMILGKIQK